MKVHLLVIDPQEDFCDGPWPAALPVPGAHADMLRLAAMIDRIGQKLDDIHITMDSHHLVDIAHPAYWVNSAGDPPAPFTIISAADVEAGVWTPRNPGFRKHARNYVAELERLGNYPLMIWPPHCLIGTPGHNVHRDVSAALLRWCEREHGVVRFVTKGSNLNSEHYSAFQAEVPDPNDPSTLPNMDMVRALQDADVIAIAGEALSHCVRATVTDIANAIGDDYVRKFVFLTDCSSPVPAVPNGGPDFPAIGQQFIRDMQARGMQLATSTTFLA